MPPTISENGKTVGASLALFLLSLVLTAFTSRRPEVASRGVVIMSELFAPIQIGASYAVSSVSGVWHRYVALTGAVQERDALAERLKVLEGENTALRENALENVRLRSLLSMAESRGGGGLGAQVIGYSASNWVQTITVSRGALDGVRVGMSVVAAQGLVGQVIAVGLQSAKVLLVTDPTSGVDAMTQEGRVRGVVEGLGGTRCRWGFVLRDEDLKIGDAVVTSGMDGIYPKGLTIGVVSAVEGGGDGMFRAVEIHPAVDFSSLEEVIVLPAPVRESPLAPVPTNFKGSAKREEAKKR